MAIRLQIALPATTDILRRAREEVVTIAETDGAAKSVTDEVQLAVNEAVTNVLRHAYANGEGTLELGVGSNGHELTVVVRDWGKGFDPTHEGLGLRIIARCTKRYMIAASPGGGTEVVMTFDLRPGDEHPAGSQS